MKGAAVIVIVTEEVHATTRKCLTSIYTLKSKFYFRLSFILALLSQVSRCHPGLALKESKNTVLWNIEHGRVKLE